MKELQPKNKITSIRRSLMKAEMLKKCSKPLLKFDGNVNLAFKSRPITATYLENKSEKQQRTQTKEAYEEAPNNILVSKAETNLDYDSGTISLIEAPDV